MLKAGEMFSRCLGTTEVIPNNLYSKEKNPQVFVNREIIPDANHGTWDSFVETCAFSFDLW